MKKRTFLDGRNTSRQTTKRYIEPNGKKKYQNCTNDKKKSRLGTLHTSLAARVKFATPPHSSANKSVVLAELSQTG